MAAAGRAASQLSLFERGSAVAGLLKSLSRKGPCHPRGGCFSPARHSGGMVLGGVLPLPRPSSLAGAGVPKVPGSSPERAAMLDSWTAAINELNAGGAPFVTPDASSPLAAAQRSALAFACMKIGRFPAVPSQESDCDSFIDVCSGLDYGGAPCSGAPLQESLLSLRPEGSRPRGFVLLWRPVFV